MGNILKRFKIKITNELPRDMKNGLLDEDIKDNNSLKSFEINFRNSFYQDFSYKNKKSEDFLLENFCIVKYFPRTRIYDDFDSSEKIQEDLIIFKQKEFSRPFGIISSNFSDDENFNTSEEIFDYLEEFALNHSGIYPIVKLSILKFCKKNEDYCLKYPDGFYIGELLILDRFSINNPYDFYKISFDDSYFNDFCQFGKYFCIEIGGSKKKHPFRYAPLKRIKNGEIIDGNVSYCIDNENSYIDCIIENDSKYDSCGFIQEEVQGNSVPASVICYYLEKFISEKGYVPKVEITLNGIQANTGASINIKAKLLITNEKDENSDEIKENVIKICEYYKKSAIELYESKKGKEIF